MTEPAQSAELERRFCDYCDDNEKPQKVYPMGSDLWACNSCALAEMEERRVRRARYDHLGPSAMTELEKNQRQALEWARSAFAEAVREMEDMLPYVPDYFREKWGYDESIAYAQAELTHLEGFLCITTTGDHTDGTQTP